MLMISDQNYYPLPGSAENSSGEESVFAEGKDQRVISKVADGAVLNHTVDRRINMERPEGSDYRR